MLCVCSFICGRLFSDGGPLLQPLASNSAFFSIANARAVACGGVRWRVLHQGHSRRGEKSFFVNMARML